MTEDRLNKKKISEHAMPPVHTQQFNPNPVAEEPEDVYKVKQTDAAVQKTWQQDPKLLTKSTLNPGEEISPEHRHKFLPQLGSAAQPQNGYISDFYKKKQYTSDGSAKVPPPVV